MSIEDEIQQRKRAQEMMEREGVAKELAERDFQSTPQAIRARLQKIIGENPGSVPAVRALIDSQTPELVKEIFDYLASRGTKTIDTQLLTMEPFPHFVRVTSVQSNKPNVSVFPLESGAGVSVHQQNTPLSWGKPIKPFDPDSHRLLERYYSIDAFMKDDAPIITFRNTEIRTTDEAWEDTLRHMVIAGLSKDE